MPELRCLGGNAGPADLGDKLATLLDLPEAVRNTYREVLEPNLEAVLDDRTETRVKRYCRRYEIEPTALAPSVMALRLLMLQAVVVGADREAFSADVNTLLPDGRGEQVLGVVLPVFDAVMPKLTQAAIVRTVAEHGKVVRDVRWRMNMITASDHGQRMQVPIATITLLHQEGPNASQTTYQLLPDEARKLQKALAQILDEPLTPSR